MKKYLAPNVTVNESIKEFTLNFINIDKSIYKGKATLDKEIEIDKKFKKCTCDRNHMNKDYSGITRSFCKNYGKLYQSLQSCGNPNCVIKLNRMKKKASKLQLEVFLTKNRGWGLRTRNRIMPFQYICEYVGELWLEDEYDSKEKGWYCYEVQANGITYIYDAEKEGNFARMINHSCSNNSIAIACSLRDDLIYKGEKIPQLGIFAADKIIEPGEEICINYNDTYFIDGFDCLCGSDICISKRKKRRRCNE
ncbi:G9a [Strongyloides ratti]|uniref:G9a n=1 Tax=Strongyloides ratti TaxID=34506 RepID=A0A090LDU2_STRRB|nr:G9a [Strongyloides ratti]CEF67932.1 G9a [Strongyloides ratti]